MSESDAQLFDRHRATLAGRVTRILVCLREDPATASDPERQQEILGELHTLKGEARMLGLADLSSLAHALEEAVGVHEGGSDDVVCVLDSLVLALADGTPPDLRNELIATGLHALGQEEKIPAARAVSDAVQESKRETWIQVNARIVQELSETLAGLSADFARFTDRERAREGRRDDATRVEGERLGARLRDCLALSLSLRLVSLGQEMQRLESHARRLAGQGGRSIEVNVRASGVLVERRVLDTLRDPLLHLVNNAIEHGLADREGSARLDLVAENVGSRVVVKIKDYGRGIDRASVEARARELGLVTGAGLDDQKIHSLLFEPGFSTRRNADEGAGRGVGLEVVKRHVAAAGGTIEVESVLGEWTCFTVSVPAPMAQGRVLVVRAGEATCALPVEWIEGIATYDDAAHEGEHYRYEGSLWPRASLAQLLGMKQKEDERKILAMRMNGTRVVVACETIVDQFKVLKRPTHPVLGRHFGIAATASLPDGTLVYVLDGDFLHRQISSGQSNASSTSRRSVMRPRVLVVDDSPIVRDLVQEVLEASGFDVRTAVDGRGGLVVFDEFLPQLVLTDIEMPQMDGFSLLEELRKRSETLPVVMLSAKRSDADRNRATRLGASAYVVKSEFEGDALVNLVSRYCCRDSS